MCKRKSHLFKQMISLPGRPRTSQESAQIAAGSAFHSAHLHQDLCQSIFLWIFHYYLTTPLSHGQLVALQVLLNSNTWRHSYCTPIGWRHSLNLITTILAKKNIKYFCGTLFKRVLYARKYPKRTLFEQGLHFLHKWGLVDEQQREQERSKLDGELT